MSPYIDTRRLDEAEVRALHERAVLILGNTDFSDEEYFTALEAASESGSLFSPSARREALAKMNARSFNPKQRYLERLRAIVGGDGDGPERLTASQEEKLDGDILDTLAKQRLRERGIGPDEATFEDYSAALEEAQHILDVKENT